MELDLISTANLFVDRPFLHESVENFLSIILEFYPCLFKCRDSECFWCDLLDCNWIAKIYMTVKLEFSIPLLLWIFAAQLW